MTTNPQPVSFGRVFAVLVFAFAVSASMLVRLQTVLLREDFRRTCLWRGGLGGGLTNVRRWPL